MLSESDCNGTVGMNLFDGAGSETGGTGFVRSLEIASFQHALSNCKFVLSAFGIGCQKTFVNSLLSHVSQCDGVCDKRDVEMHVASKDQASW